MLAQTYTLTIKVIALEIEELTTTFIDSSYNFVTKSLLMLELALIIRCLSTTLNHGTNGSLLEILKLGDGTMPPSLLDLNSCPAYPQVGALPDPDCGSSSSVILFYNFL